MNIMGSFELELLRPLKSLSFPLTISAQQPESDRQENAPRPDSKPQADQMSYSQATR